MMFYRELYEKKKRFLYQKYYFLLEEINVSKEKKHVCRNPVLTITLFLVGFFFYILNYGLKSCGIVFEASQCDFHC